MPREEEIPTRDNLNREFILFKAGSGRGRLLERCRDTLLAVPPTSVQPERDFSALRQLLGEDRSSLSSKTLDAIFLIKRAFQHGAA